MTNEIKEILECLEKYGQLTPDAIDDLHYIRYYIINLQNEIFDLKDTIQNKNDCIGAYECIIEDRDKRIDKAIEYIVNNYDFYYGDDLLDEYNEIVDILRGDE